VLCILSICLLILHLSVAICEICLLYFTYGVCLVLSLKPGVTLLLLHRAPAPPLLPPLLLRAPASLLLPLLLLCRPPHPMTPTGAASARRSAASSAEVMWPCFLLRLRGALMQTAEEAALGYYACCKLTF
jgi:hypothetical protein